MDDGALRAQIKAEIRQRRRAVRAAFPADARAARSANICAALVALPEWASAQTVLAFVSMSREVQTGDAVERAWAEQKRVAAPRMGEDLVNLEVREWARETELEESGYAFMQPPSDAPVVEDAEVDLVIVPALAADDRGHRIGYGKGYYDRLLPRLTRAVRVIVAFDFELIAEVPDRPTDARGHIVVTDVRVLRPAP
jgi:5-formyltetrahydrofolate cyclo-ligase